MKRIYLLLMAMMVLSVSQTFALPLDEDPDEELMELVDSSQADGYDAFSDTTSIDSDEASLDYDYSSMDSDENDAEDLPGWFKSLFVGSSLIMVIMLVTLVVIPLLLPIALFLLFLWWIVRRSKKKNDSFDREYGQTTNTKIEDNMPTQKKLYRSDNRILGGVCAGLAEYLDLDPTVVRVAYALLTLFTAFSGIIVYIILLLLMPQK